MSNFKESDFIRKENIYYPNYDILLNLSAEKQKEYLNFMNNLNRIEIKQTEPKKTEWRKLFSEWKGGNMFGQTYKYKSYVKHIEDKMEDGVIFDKATMSDYEDIKTKLKRQQPT